MAKYVYQNISLPFPKVSSPLHNTNASNLETTLSNTSELRISRFSNFVILNSLTPGQSLAPGKNEVRILTDPSQVIELYQGVDLLSIDIETTGLNCNTDRIVGMGFAATGRPSSYLPVTGTFPDEVLRPFLGRLVGFNVSFETQFLPITQTANAWAFDVYGLYKQLACEGWKGQKWGLKNAQLDLLQWGEKGDEELDRWLVENGWWTSSSNTPKEGYISHEGKFKRPDKSQMSKAPVEILGYYCALDSHSTLEILTKVLLPAMAGQPWEPAMRSYHQLFLENVLETVRNQLVGFTVDPDMLTAHIEQLDRDLVAQVDSLFSHPHIRRLAGEYWEAEFDKVRAKEPNHLTRAGKVSKNWEKWREKMDEMDGPEDARAWVNFGSGPQMQYLFYDLLNLPVLQRTKKDGASVGVKAMKGFGELGQLMLGKRKIEKELGYVSACLDNLCPDAQV